MSFQLELDPKSEAASRFFSSVLEAIQKAYVESGYKQGDIAERLEIDRSAVSRRLNGECNLTLRTIAELGWAMDAEPFLDFRDCRVGAESNEPSGYVSAPTNTKVTFVDLAEHRAPARQLSSGATKSFRVTVNG